MGTAIRRFSTGGPISNGTRVYQGPSQGPRQFGYPTLGPCGYWDLPDGFLRYIQDKFPWPLLPSYFSPISRNP